METKKMDRRTIKTKRAIRNALADLLAKKELSEITVTDIADTADINRKTFYAYYKGVYEVVDEIENEMVSIFEKDFEDLDFQTAVQDPAIMYCKLTAVFKSDPDFYTRMFQVGKAGNNASLAVKLADRMKERSAAFLIDKNAGDPGMIRLVVEYTVSGVMAVYQSWMASGCKMPMEEVSHALHQLIFNGINSGLLQLPFKQA